MLDVEELLHPSLLKAARDIGYTSFNKLQLTAFKVLRRGVNTVISAPTGYGKTEAALFPVLSSILERGVEQSGIYALYITPLRALNRDIFNRMRELASSVGIALDVRHGDTPQSARRRIAEHPPHVLITTPETLQLVLVSEKLRKALERVQWVIVDELHELVPSKRGLQLAIALERLEQVSRRRVQRIGLSATLKNPLEAGLFLTGGRNFEIVELREGRQYEIDVVFAGTYEGVDERMKLLLEIFRRHGSVLIFVNTRDTAEALGTRLREMVGSGVAVHHGSLSREHRVEAERALKEGKLKCLVATSSLELGIDVGHVDYVVQYMSPRQVNRLVQRVGRSSHYVGGVARGAIIAADLDDLAESIVIARRAERGNLEDIEFEENAYDVLTHQLVGLVLERGNITLEEAYNLISRAFPYRNLKLEELRRVVDFAASVKLLRFDGERLAKGARSIRYYYEAASTIPDVESLDVIDITSRRRIGALDGDFVSSSLAEGARFVLGGRAWEVVKISIDDGKVFVAPAEGPEAAIPAWVGEDLPVPFVIAREVGALRRRLLEEPIERLAEELRVGTDLLNLLKNYVERQKSSTGVVATDKTVVIEYGNRILVFHCCLGTRANALLALLLSYYLAKAKGVSSKFFYDAYRIVLALSRDISPEELAKALVESGIELLKYVREAVKGSTAYLWKLLHVCQRMGIVEKGSRLKIPARKLAEVFEGTVVEDEAIRELMSTRFDLKTLELFLSYLKRGKITLEVVRVKEFSPMAKSMFEKPYRAGLLTAGLEKLIVLEHVRKRLGKTKLLLICLHCLRWSSEIVVDDAPEEIRCPKCGSKAIAALNHWEGEALKILEKWRRGARLSREEEEVVRNAQKSAILVMSYGRKALICLAGKGVGPTVAARILSVGKSEEELVKEVVKAEVEYLRTREFWHEPRAVRGRRSE